MENIVIQSDINNLSSVENFVRAICDTNHIVNYYATISVPVMKAVESVIQAAPSSALSILFDHCRGGITFTVQSATPCFSPTLSAEVPPAGSAEETTYLITMLADQMEVTDEGRTLQLFFAVQGIDAEEASARIQVLEHFYERLRSHQLQLVES